MQGGGNLPLFHGELDIFFVTRSHLSQGTSLLEECGEIQGSEPMKSQCSPLQPVPAQDVFRQPHWFPLSWVEVGQTAEGWLLHLWLFSSPSKGGCQTSAVRLLSLGLGMAFICHSREECFFISSSQGCRKCVLYSCSQLQLLLRPLLALIRLGKASSAWLREGSQAPGFVFCLTMVAARPQLPHLFCSLSAPVTGFSYSMC